MLDRKNHKETRVLCTLTELHAAQLKILKHLKKVCDSNKIRYYIACGTCLGAVRHKGFIPWDSDIDVIMYAEDIDKLSKIPEINADSFFLQTYKTEKEYPYTCARLRDSNTTFIEYKEEDRDINHGVWIDIYPAYRKPDNFIKYHLTIFYVYLYHILVYNREVRDHGAIIRIISSIILRKNRGNRRKKRISELEKRIRGPVQSNMIVLYFGEDIRPFSCICYSAECFGKPSLIQFEDEMFSAPTNTDLYLKTRYGEYMRIPPKEKQVVKFYDVFIDTSRGYKEYKNKEYLI